MTEPAEEIRASVRERFAHIALAPGEETPFPIGPESAEQVGYAAEEVDSLPSVATESFAGVGNPLALGALRPGDHVVDLGCGSGMDCLLAARCVGPSGRVVGVDMVREMLAKAREGARLAGAANVAFVAGLAEELPLADEAVDVVLTNGVFNLCVDKPAVVSEVFRVLRPGGRVQMADILILPHVTAEEVAAKGAWSD